MTKIKNTKKGMAKKTLSMSLVVAMLATSNVPVWAAEFSDGSETPVATEAPAAETTTEFSDNVAETPVVDNTEDTASASAVETETPDTSSDTQGRTVWISATGSKYHSRPDCGNMDPNKATQETEAQALSQGYEACKKCW